jgi:hypothetical protein
MAWKTGTFDEDEVRVACTSGTEAYIHQLATQVGGFRKLAFRD